MNTFIAICTLISLPMSMGLNCYQCAAGSGGCSDPFNKTGSGVSTTGANSTDTYCKKLVATSHIVQRSGDASCTATTFVLDIGTACCQTDLCNEARANYQMPIISIISLAVILVNIQWI